VEEFETRLVPAVVVNNPGDAPIVGQTDLRQAIAGINVNGGTGTITFANNVTTVTLNPTNNPLALTIAKTNITINGGANKVTIQEDPTAKQSSGLFTTGNNTTLTLQNLNLGGNNQINGCGVFASSNLTITNCYIAGCSSTLGGGVDFAGGGTLTITSTQFFADSATGDGGAVYISGFNGQATATITNCTFNCCWALDGGAIAVENAGVVNAPVVTISGGSLTQNSATNWGGGIFFYNGSLTLTGGVDIDSNSCTNANPTKQYGGGNNMATQGDGMYQVNAGTSLVNNGVTWYMDSLTTGAAP
jgi:hypothetical protein